LCNERHHNLVHPRAGLVDVVTKEISSPGGQRLVKTVCEPVRADSDVQMDGRGRTGAGFLDLEPVVARQGLGEKSTVSPFVVLGALILDVEGWEGV
jgi:hypothetical protein